MREDQFSVVSRLLRWVCPPALLEEIEGDLMEKFGQDCRQFGVRAARRRLLWSAIRFCRPGIMLRNRFTMGHNHVALFASYCLAISRHVRKNKLNTLFKLGGLSLAIFSFLAIAIYVSYQLTYDTHHDNHSSIYRVNTERIENGVVAQYAIVPLAIGPMLKQHVPEVEAVARTRYANGSYLRYQDKRVSCEGLIEADSTLLKILHFDYLEGNTEALQIPNAIVLTRSISTAMFGTSSALGKLVTINNDKQVYQVTAVVEDTHHTCFDFEAIILSKTEVPLTLTSISSPVEFLDLSSTLFVRMRQPVDERVYTKIDAVLDQFVPAADRAKVGFRLWLQPLRDVYLGPQLQAEFAVKGSPIYVYAFATLGIILLVVAGINYINLTLADFNGRSRETGVRKVLGARSHQLIAQVATEAILFSLISLLVGIGLLYFLFPRLQSMLDRDLQFGMLLNTPVMVMVGSGFALLIGFSSYLPARKLASMRIDLALKSASAANTHSSNRILFLAQFVIAAVCIGCTIVVSQQISFIHHKELGFDRNNLIVLSMPSEFSVAGMKTLKTELRRTPGITHVSNSSFRIGGGYWKDWYFVEQEGQEEMKHVELYEVFSDDELFATLGIKMMEGRTFDADIPSDSGAAFIVNQSAVRELGWKNPIGKRIYTHPEEKGKWDGTVVGVVSDINISPLYERVRPLVMRLPWTNAYPDFFVYVRYEGDVKPVLKAIEANYQALMPGYPLAYRFVDEFYNSRHQKENKAFASLQLATLIIIMVSMFGIIAMAAYLSVRRMKEFGIRKVLGASVRQIFVLHMNYFVRLVIIANVLALPATWWLVRNWLDTFAYRIEPGLWPFVVAAMISFFMVLISGSYSALKSGLTNPIEVIKSE